MVLDAFYKKKGEKIERIVGKANRHGDLRINGVLSEEKGLRFDEWLAYEIIQAVELLPQTKVNGDIATVPVNAIGNQFTSSAVLQIWICYDNQSPKHIYKVEKQKLDAFYLTKESFEKYDIKKVTKYYGLTLCAKLPWDDLLQIGVATVVWSFDEDAELAWKSTERPTE